MSIEYADRYIGDCVSGNCDRPATVVVYEELKFCALHHARYEVGQQIDEASLTLELLKAWRSQAKMHRLEGLELELWRIAVNADARLNEFERLSEQIRQAHREDGEFETGLRTAGGSQ